MVAYSLDYAKTFPLLSILNLKIYDQLNLKGDLKAGKPCFIFKQFPNKIYETKINSVVKRMVL